MDGQDKKTERACMGWPLCYVQGLPSVAWLEIQKQEMLLVGMQSSRLLPCQEFRNVYNYFALKSALS